MSQSGILAFDSSHIGLADNLIAIGNELGINLETIGDIEKTLPETHHRPQGLKGIGTMVPYDPAEDTGLEVVNGSPNPEFVFFEPTNVCHSSSSPTSGIASGS